MSLGELAIYARRLDLALVDTCPQGAISEAFYYGPEHQRIKQISSARGTTVYLNPDNNGALFFEKDIKPNGSVEQRAFINVDGQAVAIIKTTSGTTARTIRYLHRDALGSITAVTDENREVVVPERLAYEPFGKRRFANDPNNTIAPKNTDRGFTGHEMLDEIGLIHMNGRVYDPLVGRFLSADPYIQSPGNLQSYNRYSYVMNNPLGYTDPSGYSWWTAIRDTAVQVGALIADAYGCSGYCSMAVGAYRGYQSGGVSGAVLGGVAGYVSSQAMVNHAFGNGWTNAAIGGFTYNYAGSGGNLQAGLQGAGSALLFFGAGSFADYQQNLGYSGWGDGGLGRAAAHAVAGCIGAAAGGGNCGNGALSAGFAEGVGGRIQFDTVEPNLVARTVIGGTASVLGGGKFANGAATGAFGYLFNQLGRQGSIEVDPSTPEGLEAYRTLQPLADAAAENIDATCDWRCVIPWIRGTLIHTEFGKLIDALDPALGFSSEISYLDGDVVKRGRLGSSRADAVYGPIEAPIEVYDLKTGGAKMSYWQIVNYGANLPPGTPFSIIRPRGE